MKNGRRWSAGATALLLAASMMTTALATDLDIQIIGEEEKTAQTLDLSDMQLGATYEIEGYARILPVSFQFVDYFPQFDSGMNGDLSIKSNNDEGDRWAWEAGYEWYVSISRQESGEEAEFAWLLLDLVNRQKEPVNFMEEIEVKAVFDEEYEFAGWVRQFNYDYDDECDTNGGATGITDLFGSQVRAGIQPDSEEAIDMMYTGHYVIGCTLPNAVVEGTEPLSLVIDLDGNELIYNVRK